ncbi:MAG: RIP metalloprotease RseP [Candidatus Omnitrophica bacterium]|nr:RIP metalloprotease RseP [Candidatus Omnitrophota bacterium]
MFSIILFAAVLSILILVHEWGHFFVAKRLGIRVERFSLGFGPKVFSIKGKETEYQLCYFPLGGYVKMAGETRDEPLKGERWEYLSRSVWERFAVVFAGPFLNYALAFFVFTVVFVVGNPQITSKIGKVMEGYPAEEAGIQEGDRVLSVSDQKVKYWEEVTSLIHGTPEEGVIRVAVLRDRKELTFTLRPKRVEEKNLFGEKKKFSLIGISASDEVILVHYPLPQAIGMAGKQMGQLTFLTFKAIGRMLTGHLAMKESLTGPIGIFVITEQAARLGIRYLLQMIGVLSASLAIFNVLPIPVLDGGHLFFLVLERLKGKPVSERIQELSRQVGMTLLIGLMLIVFYNDFSRFKVFEKMFDFFGGF